MDTTQINLPTRKPTRPSTDNLKGTVVLFVVVFLLAIGVPGLASRLFSAVGDTWHCLTTDCNPKGPAPSWQDQLSAANAKIATQGSDYALSEVQFIPAAYKYNRRTNPWTPENALELRATYVLSNGLSYEVKFWDTNPAATSTLRKLDSLASRADYDNAVAANLHAEQFKISPRQAAESAWTLFRTQEGTYDLGLSEGFLGGLTNNNWLVSIEPVASTSVSTSAYVGTFFLVDLSTGETTMRNSFKFPPATPTPTPKP